MPLLAAFGVLDWGVVGLYFALVTAVGLIIGRRRKNQSESDYFLAGRSLPTWAVALSLVATMLSTATFVGVPDVAFGGDLTYLILNIGGIVAVFIVGLLFVPRLYRAGTVTIYGFLAQRFGEGARLAVSACFICGRLLSSGARLFLAAVALCLLMFGEGTPTFHQLAAAIALIGVVGAFYATVGGVRAVVWVDVIQFIIVVGTALLSIAILLHRIALPPAAIFHQLAAATAPSGGSKLRLLDLSLNPASSYTLWTALIGQTFFMTAAYGTDHDLAQRFLIAKSPARGAASVIASQFIGMAVVSLFLCIGLLLFLFYRQGGHPMPQAHTAMYPNFLLHELPTGLAGLAMAGLFAVAQGSLDSAMNALASSIVADVWEPLRKRRLPRTSTDAAPAASVGSHASKWVVAGVGAAMVGFALLCAAIYDPHTTTLLDFALGVMTFAFSGMLAVFLTALLTTRGNSLSVLAALLTGALYVGLLQDRIVAIWSPWFFGHPLKIAWPWWMPLATLPAFAICAAPRGKRA